VIFLDTKWYFLKTKQDNARVFRLGQHKMVYVYQLLTTGSMDEDKYRRTTWKEWIFCMILSEEFVEDPSKWQAEKIEDYILREMVEDDKSKGFCKDYATSNRNTRISRGIWTSRNSRRIRTANAEATIC
jgi:DNA repair and recombination protein RAD54 and RAD54-like protein